MAGGDASGRSLENTPTWALAVVCFVIISVSFLIEHSIHVLTNWLKRHRKTALYDAVDRLKSELMLLGFMSLLLAVTQVSISNICIPNRLVDIMLPCRKEAEVENVEHLVVGLARTFLPTGEIYNRTVWKVPHRRLADDDAADDDGGATTGSCGEGKASLVSQEGLHQLHIFIFVLAVMQIVYSVLTMGLGRAKMRSWKAWEEETQTTEYQVENDPNRFRFTRQTTFGRRHMTHCSDSSLYLWIKCFFRQFFHSVEKVDYLTLRHGFIAAHLSARHNNFNFQKYIQRSLEEDFKVVVSIRFLILLLYALLLANCHHIPFYVVFGRYLDACGCSRSVRFSFLFSTFYDFFEFYYSWNVYLWVSYAPLLIVLVLGTKLQVVVARMALQLHNQNSVIIGAPVVQPHDDLFWFGRPMFVLTLLHLTLFVIQFGFNSCYHEHTVIIITRIVLAVSVQVLCSYITLPLHALVTQMGSQFKSKVLEEQTSRILKQWHAEVRQKRRQQERQYSFVSPRTSLSTDWSLRNSPIDFSSHRRPLAMPTDQSTSNRGEITEE
ncbi:hypothetical protein RHGRI_011567 [Rhododendron griersonianum]|uniref:MLO-like protein n=1 Tax=Rhododendron griersonianum TaxID=479676 RepID=A0AAV6KMB3_9ERIC|nr:hypothetical protein RHGRI_011567 [Rhododendron griersonianum]